MPQGNNSQPRKVANKPLPELEYVPIDDSYMSTRQFRAKLQQAKKTKVWAVSLVGFFILFKQFHYVFTPIASISACTKTYSYQVAFFIPRPKSIRMAIQQLTRLFERE